MSLCGGAWCMACSFIVAWLPYLLYYPLPNFVCGGLSKFAKMMVVHWRLDFLWQGQLCFPVHLYGLIHLYLKNVDISNHFFAGLGGSVGCAVRLETRRLRVQPPSRSATFFRGDWSWNIFYGHSLPSADSRRAVVIFWRKNVHNTG